MRSKILSKKQKKSVEELIYVVDNTVFFNRTTVDVRLHNN